MAAADTRLELEAYLSRCFGASRAAGERMVALSDAHALHESGYDVAYSRYALVYRDRRREVVLGAEMDEDGLLVLHSAGVEGDVLERIGTALRFLNVGHRHES